jgi:hypothetical protein
VTLLAIYGSRHDHISYRATLKAIERLTDPWQLVYSTCTTLPVDIILASNLAIVPQPLTIERHAMATRLQYLH